MKVQPRVAKLIEVNNLYSPQNSTNFGNLSAGSSTENPPEKRSKLIHHKKQKKKESAPKKKVGTSNVGHRPLYIA